LLHRGSPDLRLLWLLVIDSFSQLLPEDVLMNLDGTVHLYQRDDMSGPIGDKESKLNKDSR